MDKNNGERPRQMARSFLWFRGTSASPYGLPERGRYLENGYVTDFTAGCQRREIALSDVSGTA